MSGVGGRHRRRMLALRARAAALRFGCGRRGADDRHEAWRSLALRWRRRRRPAAPRRVHDRIAPIATTIWAPRFHLHAIAAGERAQRAEARASAPIRATRATVLVERQRHWATVRFATVTMQRLRVLSILCASAAGTVEAGTSPGGVPPVTRLARALIASLTVSRARHRLQHGPVARPLAVRTAATNGRQRGGRDSRAVLRGAAARPAPRFHRRAGPVKGERASRAATHATAPIVTARPPAGSVTHRHWTTVRLSTVTMHWHRGDRVSPASEAGTVAAAKHVVAVSSARFPRPTIGSPVASPTRHRLPRFLTSRRPMAIRTAVTNERHRPATARLPSPEPALPPLHRRTAAVEDALGRRRHSSPLHSPLARGEELLWRRAARAATPSAAGDPDSDAPPPVARSAPRSFPPREASAEPSASALRPAPRPLTQLDPALFDRLADDVIRRIEKRARIERDRRGL